MAVELHVQMPAGHKTEDRKFLSGQLVRVAGRVTAFWGIPVGLEHLDIHIRNAAGVAVRSVRVNTNLVGNFWWDTNLPTAEGMYTVFADAFLYGNASLPIEISPLAAGPSFQIAVDPAEGWVGGAVRVTARIQLNNVPLQGVYVRFVVQAPSGAPAGVDAYTDSRGFAWTFYQVVEVGPHTVAVYSGADGRWLVTYFTAAVPPDPTIIPEPIPLPEPPNGVDQADTIGNILGMVAPMLMMALLFTVMREMEV